MAELQNSPPGNRYKYFRQYIYLYIIYIINIYIDMYDIYISRQRQVDRQTGRLVDRLAGRHIDNIFNRRKGNFKYYFIPNFYDNL